LAEQWLNEFYIPHQYNTKAEQPRWHEHLPAMALISIHDLVMMAIPKFILLLLHQFI